MQKIIYIAFIFLLNSICVAQTAPDSTYFQRQYKPNVNYTIKTRSGSIYTGYVKQETKEFINLENRITHETVELRKTGIIRISQTRGRDLANEIMGENLHAKNYMFLSSAFLFDPNKASTNSHWLLLENIDYAFSENWAISLNTLAFYPITLGVKCSYQLNEETYLGANVFGIGDIMSNGNSNLLFGYGAQGKLTKGSSNKNFTLSGGVIGLSSDLFYTTSTNPYVNLAFVSAAYCNRFSKKVALNLEGWFIPELNAGLGGIGFKFVGDEVTCWTVGCYTLLNSYDNTLKLNLRTVPIPYFGVSKRFN